MAMALTADYDADLPVVQALQQGDPYALDELMRRHGGWVRSVAYGILGDADRVDDVCQQTWSLVWEQIRQLREPTRWKAWTYRLVRNAAVDAGREKTRARRNVEELANAALADRVPYSPPAAEKPDQVLGRREQAEVVKDAIRGLAAIYREPFVLRHVEGWSYKQIAEAMEMPVDTVETRLVRARRLIREALRGKV